MNSWVQYFTTAAQMPELQVHLRQDGDSARPRGFQDCCPKTCPIPRHASCQQAQYVCLEQNPRKKDHRRHALQTLMALYRHTELCSRLNTCDRLDCRVHIFEGSSRPGPHLFEYIVAYIYPPRPLNALFHWYFPHRQLLGAPDRTVYTRFDMKIKHVSRSGASKIWQRMTVAGLPSSFYYAYQATVETILPNCNTCLLSS